MQCWLEWSGGYHVLIEKMTLQDAKVQSTIARKDLIEPVKEHNAILDYFMKPHSKMGELVFKTGGSLELTLIIDHNILEDITNQQECICGSDDDDVSIHHKVCTQNAIFINVTHHIQ